MTSRHLEMRQEELDKAKLANNNSKRSAAAKTAAKAPKAAPEYTPRIKSSAYTLNKNRAVARAMVPEQEHPEQEHPVLPLSSSNKEEGGENDPRSSTSITNSGPAASVLASLAQHTTTDVHPPTKSPEISEEEDGSFEDGSAGGSGSGSGSDEEASEGEEEASSLLSDNDQEISFPDKNASPSPKQKPKISNKTAASSTKSTAPSKSSPTKKKSSPPPQQPPASSSSKKKKEREEDKKRRSRKESKHTTKKKSRKETRNDEDSQEESSAVEDEEVPRLKKRKSTKTTTTTRKRRDSTASSGLVGTALARAAITTQNPYLQCLTVGDRVQVDPDSTSDPKTLKRPDGNRFDAMVHKLAVSWQGRIPMRMCYTEHSPAAADGGVKPIVEVDWENHTLDSIYEAAERSEVGIGFQVTGLYVAGPFVPDPNIEGDEECELASPDVAHLCHIETDLAKIRKIVLDGLDEGDYYDEDGNIRTKDTKDKKGIIKEPYYKAGVKHPLHQMTREEMDAAITKVFDPNTIYSTPNHVLSGDPLKLTQRHWRHDEPRADGKKGNLKMQKNGWWYILSASPPFAQQHKNIKGSVEVTFYPLMPLALALAIYDDKSSDAMDVDEPPPTGKSSKGKGKTEAGSSTKKQKKTKKKASTTRIPRISLRDIEEICQDALDWADKLLEEERKRLGGLTDSELDEESVQDDRKIRETSYLSHPWVKAILSAPLKKPQNADDSFVPSWPFWPLPGAQPNPNQEAPVKKSASKKRRNAKKIVEEADSRHSQSVEEEEQQPEPPRSSKRPRHNTQPKRAAVVEEEAEEEQHDELSGSADQDEKMEIVHDMLPAAREEDKKKKKPSSSSSKHVTTTNKKKRKARKLSSSSSISSSSSSSQEEEPTPPRKRTSDKKSATASATLPNKKRKLANKEKTSKKRTAPRKPTVKDDDAMDISSSSEEQSSSS